MWSDVYSTKCMYMVTHVHAHGSRCTCYKCFVGERTIEIGVAVIRSKI